MMPARLCLCLSEIYHFECLESQCIVSCTDVAGLLFFQVFSSVIGVCPDMRRGLQHLCNAHDELMVTESHVFVTFAITLFPMPPS